MNTPGPLKAIIMRQLSLLLALAAALNGSLHAATFTEEYYLYCGAVVELGPVGYPTWNPPGIVRPPQHGTALIFTTAPFPDSLIYKSDYGYLGVDTFVVACARATQITCDTGIYIMHIVGCPPVNAFEETHHISCDSTLLVPGLGYPVWVSPEIIGPPSNGQAVILGADALTRDTLQYMPAPGFNGTDTVIVQCAFATQIYCETGYYIIDVDCTSLTQEHRQGFGLVAYPNPATGFIFVKASHEVHRVVVSTPAGIPLRSMQPDVPAAELKISLQGLPPGCYFLTAWSGQAVESRAFFIER